MPRPPKHKTKSAGSHETKAAPGPSPVEVGEPLKPILQLLPYQRRWVEDQSQLKIVVKGRQTGYSFTATVRAVLRCLERRTTWIFLSKGERQSRLLMEKVQDHVQSCGILLQASESQFFEGTMLRQLEVRFPNGSVIYGLPANPDTARGYSGNVTLDEFAFHQDAEKIYTSLYPTITRGYSLEVISTPNGQGGKFFQLAKEAELADNTAGDPTERAPEIGGRAPSRWSGHWCDIYKAVREGMKVDIEALRAGVDDETWRQEFCCEFISGGSQWIAPELFQQCVSSEASSNFDFQLSSLDRPDSSLENLYAGWDIARYKDASVIWISELVGDVSWTRGIIEMRKIPTPDQIREARALMPYLRRMNIDKSGMGLAIFEALERDYPGKVEGVQFTQGRKESMAVLAKRRMEEAKVRLPDDDRIRQSFRSVQKTVNSLGQPRFDAEHDEKYGHADHWWAFCMAEAAAERPSYHLAGVGGLVGRPTFAGMKSRVF
ncbi:MAG: terminase large subunit domain-containing protein [Terriglobia bacterium]